MTPAREAYLIRLVGTLNTTAEIEKFQREIGEPPTDKLMRVLRDRHRAVKADA